MTPLDKLTEAADPWVWFVSTDGRNMPSHARNGASIIAAIQAALPDGHYLGREGVVRAVHVCDLDWDVDHEQERSFPFACNWTSDADVGRVVAGSPLFVITPVEGEQ